MLDQKKQELKDLLVQEGVSSAIEALKRCVLSKSTKQNELVSIEAEHKLTSSAQIKGTIDFEETKKSHNNTVDKLLNLIDSLEEKDFNSWAIAAKGEPREAPLKPSIFLNYKIEKILIVHDDSSDSQKVKADLSKNFLDETIDLSFFNCNKKEDEAALKELMGEGDSPFIGLFFIFTKTISDLKFPIYLIEKWAIANEDKPIVYVDLTDQANNFSFGKVNKKNAGKGLWRLLAQASSRTSFWRRTALKYEGELTKSNMAIKKKRWAIGGLLLFLALFGVCFYCQNQAHRSRISEIEEDRKQENVVHDKDLNNHLDSMKEERSRFLYNWLICQKAVLNYSFFKESRTDKVHLSIWGLEKQGTRIGQLARTDKEDNNNLPSSFPADTICTIVACALKHPTIGIYFTKEGKEFFSRHHEKIYCDYSKDEEDAVEVNRVGIYCISKTDQLNNRKYVLCSDFFKDKNLLSKANTKDFEAKMDSILTSFISMNLGPFSNAKKEKHCNN